LPVGGVGGGVIVGIVKEGFKEVTVAEWVGWVNGCGSILIETLRRANGDLERIDILLIHFVWKRANVEKSFWRKFEGLSYFLTGKLIGPSNKGSLWSAESLLKTNFKFAGLSSGSSGKLAAVCN
jgi:hypothetical protein